MKCIECGACIRNIGKHKIKCLYTDRVMDEKTEQPKWCKDGHKSSALCKGIILDDDGYVF